MQRELDAAEQAREAASARLSELREDIAAATDQRRLTQDATRAAEAERAEKARQKKEEKKREREKEFVPPEEDGGKKKKRKVKHGEE